MKAMKYFTVLFLVLCLCQIAVAEKRVKQKPMKELTEPSSPSYVPFPYPKKRNEIVEDLKYAINILFVDKQGTYAAGDTPEIKKILTQLSGEKSGYKVGNIIKVKNRSHRKAHDYSWLILIMGTNGDIEARVSITAEGLFSCAAATKNAAVRLREKYPNSRRGPQFLITEQEVIHHLSEVIGRNIEMDEIKKMERVAFQSKLGYLLAPMWEIKTSMGKIYYYSVIKDTVYDIEKRITWKKNKNGFRRSLRELVPEKNDFVTDTVNDEILVLKALKKKDKDNK
jgi:hypothetical protein